MNPVVVRNEIDPLLSALIRQLTAEGRATERAIYGRIHDSLRNAKNPCELARSFSDLSIMSQVRPGPAGDAQLLLARILEKAAELALAADESPTVH